MAIRIGAEASSDSIAAGREGSRPGVAFDVAPLQIELGRLSEDTRLRGELQAVASSGSRLLRDVGRPGEYRRAVAGCAPEEKGHREIPPDVAGQWDQEEHQATEAGDEGKGGQ